MPAHDDDVPPATDDEVVQQYLSTKWREAVRAGRDGMECMRGIYPELTQHLPETATDYLRDTLNDFERALKKLHLAGPHVLGRADYDDFTAAQTRRQIES